MLALWIVLGVLAFFALLLSGSATVYVSIRDEVKISVGAFGYRRAVDLAGDKPEKPKKKKKKPQKQAAPPEKPREKPGKKTFGETVEFAKQMLASVLPGVKTLAGRLRLTDLRLYMTVAEDDADRTAIEYGAVSAGIYTLLGALDSTLTLKVKSVDILPDFVTGEPVYDISFKVKLRLIHILCAGAGMFVRLIGNTGKAEPAPEPAKKR